MCKIFVMSGINDSNRDGSWDLIQQMAKEMSHKPENDGMGYAAMSSEGVLFGERWLYNDDAFRVSGNSTVEDHILAQFQGALLREPGYDSFGNPEANKNKITSITLHSRFATSGKEFSNTHPFVNGNTSLIHNGVIHNADKFKRHLSTCDSEALLTQYVDLNITNVPSNIQKLADATLGYYACGVFSRTASGQPILDVFKDYRADLSAAYIRDLNVLVMTTEISQLEAACEKLDFKILTKFMVASGFLIRMDALTGKVIDTFEFNPKTYTYEKKRTKRSVEDYYESLANDEKFSENYGYEHEGWPGHTRDINIVETSSDDWSYDRATKVWKKVNGR